jgi:hypothetical protein
LASERYAVTGWPISEGDGFAIWRCEMVKCVHDDVFSLKKASQFAPTGFLDS